MPIFHEGINWTTTEQVHPSMRFNGAPCYYKYVDFGQLPNATSKSVAHGITGLDQVVHHLLVPRDGSDVRRSSPWISSSTSSFALYIDQTNVSVVAQADQSGSTESYVFMIYTKS